MWVRWVTVIETAVVVVVMGEWVMRGFVCGAIIWVSEWGNGD